VSGFTIAHEHDFERPFPKWALARKALGVQSFGINLLELSSADTIPEHDETDRDQEEVFIVLSGDTTMVIDGEPHPAPAGTWVRLDPEPRRTIVCGDDGPATVLIVSAPRTSGYAPMEWA
jgi:quercetin dioxygenase-like cupin family protein